MNKYYFYILMSLQKLMAFSKVTITFTLIRAPFIEYYMSEIEIEFLCWTRAYLKNFSNRLLSTIDRNQ